MENTVLMDNLKTLNMCDFCSREIETCGAKMIRAKELHPDQSHSMDPDSVVACDKYQSPVEDLKQKFHWIPPPRYPGPNKESSLRIPQPTHDNLLF